MKKKKLVILVCLLLLATPILLWPFRGYFIGTLIGDIYISLFRPEKGFDENHVVTELSESHKKIIVNIHDQCVCRFLRVAGHWEKKTTNVLKRLVKPNQIILEVGANYGYYTLSFAHWLKGQGKIIAYEANPAVVKYLEQSLKLNGDDKIVQLMPVAASDRVFDAYLTYGQANIGGGYVVTPESAEFEGCKTSSTCLPMKASIIDEDLKDLDHIDILKIDAEGSEIPALKGATRLIDRSPNLVIVMEWCPSHLARFGDVDDFLGFLKSKGFQCWEINQDDGKVYSLNLEDLMKHPYLEIVLSRQSLSF